MENFGQQIIQWYRRNKRELPWRETGDPYVIWLSEIILQQTRVNQGLPYYLKFVKTYPTVNELAAASQNEIFKLWQGLGYYRRAENMMKAAQMVASCYNGKFPNSYHELKKLPGIGDYTAAAIASIAFGKKVAVVDGNVYRVLARVFGIKTEIRSGQAKKEFSNLMMSLLKHHHPGTFNEAVMEFGALYCVPAQPDCVQCVFKQQCYAFARNEVQTLPVVKAKKKKQKRFIYYLVLEWDNYVVVNHRKQNDIWKGLYDFPSLVYNTMQKDETIMKDILNKKCISFNKIIITAPFSNVYRHQLTHIDISARFIHILSEQKPVIDYDESLSLVSRASLSKLAVSRLVDKYLEDIEAVDK